MLSKRSSFLKSAIDTAKIWSLRSEDPHRKVGACILNKEGRVLSVGYNGLPPKFKTPRSFWLNREKRRQYVIHAEINALSLIKRSDCPDLIAITLLPCSACASSIISYGINKVAYIDDYELDKNSLDIFKFFGINVFKYEN